jgi:hypothetical protein
MNIYRGAIETYQYTSSGMLPNGEFRRIPRRPVPDGKGKFSIAIHNNSHRYIRRFGCLKYTCDIYFMEMIYFLHKNIDSLNRKSYEWALIDCFMKGLPTAAFHVSHLDESKNKTLPKDVAFFLYVC